MNISKFLSRYYNINHPGFNLLTHKDVKELFPYIYRSSFEYADERPDLVSRGEIVYVKDKLNREVPYYTPDLTLSEQITLSKYDNIDECNIKVSDKSSDKTISYDELEDLSKWELVQLFRSCEKINSKRKVSNELKLRKQTNRKKDNHDKYKRA